METGTVGAGFAHLLFVLLVWVSGRELRFVFTERAGLGLVRFVVSLLTGFGVDRLGCFTERPRVMARRIPVPGSQRKPSPYP